MDNEKDPTPPAEGAPGTPSATEEASDGRPSVNDLLAAARGDVRHGETTIRDVPRAETPVKEAPPKAPPRREAPPANEPAAAKPPAARPPAKEALRPVAEPVGAKEGEAAGREVPSATPPAARVAPGAAKTASTPTSAVAKGVPKAAAKPAAGGGALVQSAPDPPINKMRRRIVWASLAGFLATCFLMFVRFFLPRAIFEPSTIFRIGFPGDYGFGVDTKWQQQYRIWVVKNSERLFVIYARCTHLGCTPDWKESENKFKCPCHGSGYDSEGINFEGPAPRPMDRAAVETDAEGQIVVNIGKLYDWPKGGDNHFNDENAYIRV